MANGSPGASSPTPPPEDLVAQRRAASDSESTQSVLEARTRVSQAVRHAPFAVGAGEFALALFSSCRSRRNTPRRGARR
jgi:hypothetical protein